MMKNKLDFGTRFEKQIKLLQQLNCKPSNMILQILSTVPPKIVKQIQELSDERFSSMEKQFRFKLQPVIVRAYVINGSDQLNVEMGELFVNLSNFTNSIGGENTFANLSTPDRNEYHFKAHFKPESDEVIVSGVYYENRHRIEPKWTVQLSDNEQPVK